MLATHLTRLGCYVNLLPMGKREMDSQPPDVAAIVAQPVRAAGGGIFLGYPQNYAKHQNPLVQVGRRIAITMFESSKIPATWPPVLNTMQAVITPSQFCKDVFHDCGVTAPMHVVPLGVGCVYKPAPRPPDRPLTFLAFLDRGERKGGLVALNAFIQAFGDDPAYQLILKGRKPKVKVNLLNPNIETIQQDMSEQEMHQLFLNADVLIDANKGEGFGLLGRQFASCGGISLSTNWGGTADDLKKWGVCLRYKLVKANWTGNPTLDGQDLGQWAEPYTNSLVSKMKEVARKRTRYQARAQRAAAFVAQRYTWAGFAEKVLAIWRGEM
jgi:glycosyltransferase involved in cell wall biosynthesis